MDDTALLELAADLAYRAGLVIMEVRARGFETMRKTDQSPVTEADHAAEAVIVQGLRAAAPHIPVIAEEEIEAGLAPRLALEGGHEYWLVDPLDGTREFAAGRREFTVNIGLVRDNRAVLGAVDVPAYGELFAGMRGPPPIAWKQTVSGRTPIIARDPPACGLDVFASRHYAVDPRLDRFLEGRAVASVSHIGSALKIVRVAEGAGDLYPRFGRTMEWDTAGPQAVLEAAGGRLCRLDGAPLRYGKERWENPPFMCMGSGHASQTPSSPSPAGGRGPG